MTMLFVKNMVCHRCIIVLDEQLKALGLTPQSINLGEITFTQELSSDEIQAIKQALLPLGFEVMNDKKSVLIEKIKSIIINLIHNQDNKLSFNLSEILSSELSRDYGALSRLFSEVEGRTIEKFFIAQKIERVKELLVYDELTLSEIAYQLNYSSVAHLSNQFKKVTGLTPSFFKQIKDNKRKSLDEV